MFGKLASATLILTAFSFTPAEAGSRHFWWLQDESEFQANQSYYDEQEAYAQDQFNQEQYDLYMQQMRHKKKLKFDQAYYEPQMVEPKAKPKLLPKSKPAAVQTITPKPVNPVVKVVKPVKTTKSIAARMETAPVSKSISCAKGAGIVSEYGFTAVTNKSCAGSTFVYGATRSGKNFDIEVSAATGELTAVKKL